MKKISIILCTISLIYSGTSFAQNIKQQHKVNIISSGLTFNEGIVEEDGKIYVSNFGGNQLNPLNTDGKGYISILKGGKAVPFIPANGNLNAPKGMAIEDGFLYIADVQAVMVYDMKNVNAAPKKLMLPEGNLFVNDIVIEDGMAYISVTNTGKIFKMSVKNPAFINEDMIQEFASVVGANGLIIEDDVMYVASYPADGKTVADNVIYVISDLNNPKPQKLISRSGQYDGLVYDEADNDKDFDKLYFTNWVNSEVGYINMRSREIVILDINNYKFGGPADMILENGKLYISDLVNSKVIMVKI